MTELRDRYLATSLSQIGTEIKPFTEEQTAQDVGFSAENLRKIHEQCNNGGIPKESAQESLAAIQDVISKTGQQLAESKCSHLWGPFGKLFEVMKKVQQDLQVIEIIESAAQEEPTPPTKEIQTRIQTEIKVPAATLKVIIAELVLNVDAPPARGDINRLIAVCQVMIDAQDNDNNDDQNKEDNREKQTPSKKGLSNNEAKKLTIEFQETGDIKIADKIISHYRSNIRNQAMRYSNYGMDVVDDMEQIGLITAYEALQKAPRTLLEGGGNLKGYILKSTKNKMITHYHRDPDISKKKLTSLQKHYQTLREKAEQQLHQNRQEVTRLTIALEIEEILRNESNEVALSDIKLIQETSKLEEQTEYQKHMRRIVKIASVMAKAKGEDNISPETMNEARIELIESYEEYEKTLSMDAEGAYSKRTLHDTIGESDDDDNENEEENALTLEDIQSAIIDEFRKFGTSNENMQIYAYVYFEGNTYQSAADLFGINMGTVRTRLHRMRTALQASERLKKIYRSQN